MTSLLRQKPALKLIRHRFTPLLKNIDRYLFVYESIWFNRITGILSAAVFTLLSLLLGLFLATIFLDFIGIVDLDITSEENDVLVLLSSLTFLIAVALVPTSVLLASTYVAAISTKRIFPPLIEFAKSSIGKLTLGIAVYLINLLATILSKKIVHAQVHFDPSIFGDSISIIKFIFDTVGIILLVPFISTIIYFGCGIYDLLIITLTLTCQFLYLHLALFEVFISVLLSIPVFLDSFLSLWGLKFEDDEKPPLRKLYLWAFSIIKTIRVSVFFLTREIGDLYTIKRVGRGAGILFSLLILTGFSVYSFEQAKSVVLGQDLLFGYNFYPLIAKMIVLTEYQKDSACLNIQPSQQVVYLPKYLVSVASYDKMSENYVFSVEECKIEVDG